MSFHLSLGGGNLGNEIAKQAETGPVYKPRSLREQLQDRMAFHQSEITKIQDAINALTPDVEKALDALGKL